MRESAFHMPQICPTPNKICWPSQAKARKAAIRASGKVKLSHYRCRCGAWHLTSQEKV